jgi:DDE family transposase
MELELWPELSQAICDVQRRFESNPRDSYCTALIVRVHLWAVLHDRPTCWACDPKSWTARNCPEQLPDQSTMSRRMRRKDFDEFLRMLGTRLNGRPASSLLRIIDGKPLELPNHSSDPDAGWGRGVSRISFGYKLHMICSGNPMPDAFVITPLNVCEKQMAFRMIPRIGSGGYLLGDGHYDASWLFDASSHHGHQLLCPRAKPGTGLTHRYVAEDRKRAIQMLEPPGRINDFGPSLYRQRTQIEREFSQLCCFGGGMNGLPPWARRAWRVRRWVWAKLLINAARIRRNRKRRIDA